MHINTAANHQILEKKGVHGNRKHIVTKKLIQKLKVQKENYRVAFNQIQC